MREKGGVLLATSSYNDNVKFFCSVHKKWADILFYICLLQEYEGERGGVLLANSSYNNNVKFYCTVQISMLTSYVPNVKQKHFLSFRAMLAIVILYGKDGTIVQ